MRIWAVAYLLFLQKQIKGIGIKKKKAGESEAGREGARRSEKAKVPEEGGLINQALIG